MGIFSYHLIERPLLNGLSATILPQTIKKVPGLVHAECMTGMTLGARMYHPRRIVFRQLSFFAQWEDEKMLDAFLNEHPCGKTLNRGWHCRLRLLRQWGSFHGLQIEKSGEEKVPDNMPVVAVTLARMKFSQIPRFIKWGRPAEQLVRDHPGISLALATIRFPNTVSTFSVWKTVKDMVEMSKGKSQVSEPTRHIDAIKERNRKDFHHEFTALRFAAISEHGVWQGRRNIIPSLNP